MLINGDIFDKVEPHLESLSLGEIDRLVKHASEDSEDEFKKFLNASNNKSIRVIFEASCK